MADFSFRKCAVSLTLAVAVCGDVTAQRQMEWLTRGTVATIRQDGGVHVSWRLLGTDPDGVAFNVYRRRADDARWEKLNERPIAGTTSYVDSSPPKGDSVRYAARAVVDGDELAGEDPVAVWQRGYLAIPISTVAGYRPGDASVADLDGDGEYEIVLHQVSRPRDNSHAGLTGSPLLDAYELDGTRLWRIDLGRNIREGEHYTQFMAYDLDGDGRAEVACKTADGSVDGKGEVIGERDRDWRELDERSKSFGRVLSGPEFFTIFDGRTGAALVTVDYVPGRAPIDGWGGIGGNGGNDSYGNRCDRFLACVACLDGERPSVVLCRGVYGRTVLVAWDWRGGKLSRRWTFDSGISHPPYLEASGYSGMGGHSLSVGDVDGDGRDEIVYHAMVIDDDGKGLYTTGLRHGDAMHLGDLDPDRPGQEVFTVHENEGHTVAFRTPGAAMRDARTGKILWSHGPGVDVGAGLAADIDPRHRGCEAWGGPGGLRDARGRSIGPAPRSTGWAIWWDGDLLRELFGGGRVAKWNPQTLGEEMLLRVETARRVRYPSLIGDILGDWREELLVPSPDGRSLRLYTTTIPTAHRIRTLVHDPQYRLALAWQNVVYNKPPHPSFFLGHGMKPAPRPDIRIVRPLPSRGDAQP